MQLKEPNNKTIKVVYRPNEDATVRNKMEFQKQWINDILKDTNGILMVYGDTNNLGYNLLPILEDSFTYLKNMISLMVF